jgi:hypothetical protein
MTECCLLPDPWALSIDSLINSCSHDRIEIETNPLDIQTLVSVYTLLAQSSHFSALILHVKMDYVIHIFSYQSTQPTPQFQRERKRIEHFPNE